MRFIFLNTARMAYGILLKTELIGQKANELGAYLDALPLNVIIDFVQVLPAPEVGA